MALIPWWVKWRKVFKFLHKSSIYHSFRVPYTTWPLVVLIFVQITLNLVYFNNFIPISINFSLKRLKRSSFSASYKFLINIRPNISWLFSNGRLFLLYLSMAYTLIWWVMFYLLLTIFSQGVKLSQWWFITGIWLLPAMIRIQLDKTMHIWLLDLRNIFLFYRLLLRRCLRSIPLMIIISFKRLTCLYWWTSCFETRMQHSSTRIPYPSSFLLFQVPWLFV